jgi:hypothetical protein
VNDVFVVGGAAMAWRTTPTALTRDVDARFVPHGIVLDEPRQVATDLRLPCRRRASGPFGLSLARRSDA